MTDRPPVIQAWESADRRQQLDVMAAQLSDDVVLISPLTDGFRFRGRQAVAAVFASAFDLLQDIEVDAVTGSGRDWVLCGTNTLNGRNLEELQWLHLDEAGRIDRITLFIRPVSAAVALLAAIGPRLHARGALPRRAAVAARTLAPVALLMATVERHLMPRLGPRR